MSDTCALKLETLKEAMAKCKATGGLRTTTLRGMERFASVAIVTKDDYYLISRESARSIARQLILEIEFLDGLIASGEVVDFADRERDLFERI